MWSWTKAGIWAPLVGAMLLGISCSEDTASQEAASQDAAPEAQEVQKEVDPFYETVRDKPAKERREAIQVHIDEGNVSKELYFHLGNARL